MRTLDFGPNEAEFDIRSSGLLPAAFAQPAAYDAVLAGRRQLIVGRKGSGKSALCLMLARQSSGRFLSSLVTPDNSLSHELSEFRLDGVTAETSMSLFWRYILGIRVARYVVSHAGSHRGRVPDSVKAVRRFLDDNNEPIDLRSQEKLYRSVPRIKSLSANALGMGVGVEIEARSAGVRTARLLEVFEDQILRALRDLCCPVRHPRLLLLVDQLEKVWSAGVPQSNALIAGLLLAGRHVAGAFPGVRCAVFIRTDIYDGLRFAERDKFRGDEICLDWTVSSLRDLLLTRARASLGHALTSERLWGVLFPPKVLGEPTADYLISRTLRRPRDLIQLANLCTDMADKNGHFAVTTEDIAEAESQFSGWKLQDLTAEFEVSYPYLGHVLEQFCGASYVLARDSLERLISASLKDLSETQPPLAIDKIIQTLYDVGFLGIRRGPAIMYSYESAAKIEPGDREFHIHPCFRRQLRATTGTSLQLYRPITLVQEARTRRIALWGAPESGKTTFLAALNVAVTRFPREALIVGANDNSTRFLAESTMMISRKSQFPPSTTAARAIGITIKVPPEAREPRRLSRRIAQDPLLQFSVDLLDIPGSSYAPQSDTSGNATIPSEDVIEYLADCDGILFFYDPIREFERQDSYDYFESALLRIAQRRLGGADNRHARLPHHIAFCITRFDEIRVYETARQLSLISARPSDPFAFPRVDDNDAAVLFDHLTFVKGDADLISSAVKRYFYHDRMKYYVTSAIGFYLNPETRKFDPEDIQNVIPEDSGYQIRGAVHPINVLEPLLWLGQSLSGIGDL